MCEAGSLPLPPRAAGLAPKCLADGAIEEKGRTWLILYVLYSSRTALWATFKRLFSSSLATHRGQISRHWGDWCHYGQLRGAECPAAGDAAGTGA